MKPFKAILLVVLLVLAVHSAAAANTDATGRLWEAIFGTLTNICPNAVEESTERTIAWEVGWMTKQCETETNQFALYEKLKKILACDKKLQCPKKDVPLAAQEIAGKYFSAVETNKCGGSNRPPNEQVTTITVRGNGMDSITISNDGSHTISLPSDGTNMVKVTGNTNKTSTLTAAGGTTVVVTDGGNETTTLAGNGTKVVVLTGEGEKSTLTGDETNGPPRVTLPLFFLGGAKFQSPYKILDTGSAVPNQRFQLTNNGNSTVTFFGVALENRYAFVGPAKGETNTGFFWPLPWKTVPDFDAQIGFVFGNGSTVSNYTATALAGGGDFYGSMGVGLPFFRYQNATMRHQLTLELDGEISTEKEFELIHSSALLGFGYQLGYKADSLSQNGTNMCGLFSAKLGAGLLESPVMAANSFVETSGEVPRFEHEWCPAASVTFTHPVTKNIYLFVSGNFYEMHVWHPVSSGPDQWNITVGASYQIDTLVKQIGGILLGQ